jgi:branched-chain amino acid transport system substrate-binding protein
MVGRIIMRHDVFFAAIASACVLVAGPLKAEPLKIGIIESLSGSQTTSGRLYATSIQYGVGLINAAGGFNGEPVQVIEYDNAGGPPEAADKFRRAEANGVHIIFQGASSAIGGQITEDVRKHNLRNPGAEMMYINVGAEAMELTGKLCQFYHFRFTTTAPMRLNALASVMKDAGDLGTRVYSINQNYSWGQDMQAAIKAGASKYGYTVVGEVLHDVNKIQDFSPFVAKMKEANPETVITANWSNDLLLLMKAVGNAGLKVRFGTAYLDEPGSVANAGATALGHYVAHAYSNSDEKLNEDYKAKTGHYPMFIEPQGFFAVGALQQALKSVNFGGGKINVTKIAQALENVTYQSPVGPISVRKEDHQTIRPVVVSKAVKNAKYPVDGTDMGLQQVKVVSGSETIYPGPDSCQMKRPNCDRPPRVWRRGSAGATASAEP